MCEIVQFKELKTRRRNRILNQPKLPLLSNIDYEAENLMMILSELEHQVISNKAKVEIARSKENLLRIQLSLLEVCKIEL